MTEDRSQGSEGSRFDTRGVLILGVGHAVHDTYSAFLPPLMPVFIEQLMLSHTEVGLLSVFMQIPSLIQPVIGHWADRINLQGLVFIAPAVTAVLMSLLGEMPHYGWLALCLLMVGISSAAMHAVGPVMVGRFSQNRLGRGMSIWMVGGEFGRTFGPIVIVAAITGLTLKGIPWLMTGGLLMSGLLYGMLRGRTRNHEMHKRALPWNEALKRMHDVLGPLVGIITIRSVMLTALTIYLPTFITDEGHSLWLAGISLTVLQSAGMIGALAGGSLSDHWGRRRILFLSLAGSPLLLFGFLLTAGWIQLVWLFLLGLFMISITPVIMAMVQEHFPENRALANGMYMGLSFVIRSAAIIGVGLVGDHAGLRMAFMGSGVIMLLGAPLVRLLPRRPSLPRKSTHEHRREPGDG